MNASPLRSVALLAIFALPAGAQVARRGAASTDVPATTGASVARSAVSVPVQLRQALDTKIGNPFQTVIQAAERLNLSNVVMDSVATLNATYIRYADSLFAEVVKADILKGVDPVGVAKGIEAAELKATAKKAELAQIAKSLLTDMQIDALPRDVFGEFKGR